MDGIENGIYETHGSSTMTHKTPIFIETKLIAAMIMKAAKNLTFTKQQGMRFL